ncbi:MAG: cyclophilin-like fold protein [Oscillospiraceae bacterium]
MRRPAALALAALLALTLAACGARPTAETDTPTAGPSAAPAPVEPLETSTEEETEMKMNVEVGGESFTATLENNSAAAALAEMLRSEPLTIEMSDYAGFEKVGSSARACPRATRRPPPARATSCSITAAR